MGLFGGGIAGILALVTGWLGGHPDLALVFGLLHFLAYGLLAALVYGGYAVLSHYALRFVLWWCEAMPLRYVRFLDESADRILLRRVGGGYSFVHRLLLDWFAKQYTSSETGPASTAPSAPTHQQP